MGGVLIVLLLTASIADLDVKFTPKPWVGKLLRNGKTATVSDGQTTLQRGLDTNVDLSAKVIPAQGVELPVTWKDLGQQLVLTGVIEQQKFMNLYTAQKSLATEAEKMLSSSQSGKIRITRENSPMLLNLFWAVGLGNKNAILEQGEMADKRYGGAGNFASTGGWTIARGPAMDHYSKHTFIRLTAQEQALVDRVAPGIYRSCCGNSTHFPDCNHGLAMLGLLELMAAQGAGEQEMYRTAVTVNSYWFPETYLTLATFLAAQGQDWSNVNAQVVLGRQYSSASGFQQIKNQVAPPAIRGNNSCGVQ